MGMNTDRPVIEYEASNNLSENHFKKRIKKEHIDETFSIINMYNSSLGYVATLGWVGIDKITGNVLRQPAVFIDQNLTGNFDYYLSYEGYANYMDYQISQSHLVVPRNGSVMKIKNNINYFFNTHDSVSPNLNYSLDHNNSSIIMNNISIYNESHTLGLMVNLRASFDGLFDDENIGGNVNILCSVDEIN